MVCLKDHGNLHLRHNRDVNDLVEKINELQLRNLHSFLLLKPKAPVVGHNGHINDLVQELHELCTVWTIPLNLHNNGANQQPCPRTATV